MQTDKEMTIRITDEGFGDFFPAGSKVWEEKVLLGV
jgi:hypothetical protein